MAIDLTTYPAVGTALLCNIVVPGWQTLSFTDYNRSISLPGVTYFGLGQLLTITPTNSELKASNTQITITISGIGNTNITDLLAHKVKGSTITIQRGIFDPGTMQPLAIAGNPVGKFQGVVNNYTLDETWAGQIASNAISFICTNRIGLLQNRMAGRRTNSIDEKSFYPGDLAMDRVAAIANSNLNFGAP